MRNSLRHIGTIIIVDNYPEISEARGTLSGCPVYDTKQPLSCFTITLNSPLSCWPPWVSASARDGRSSANGKFTLSDAATRDYVLEQFTHAYEPIRTACTRITLQIARLADQQALEEALKTKFRVPIIDDAVDKATARGIELAEVDMLLLILEERFTVSDETRIRVENCGNVKRLKEWARRAVTAQSLDDVFAEA
jgi:hypothetical protein